HRHVILRDVRWDFQLIRGHHIVEILHAGQIVDFLLDCRRHERCEPPRHHLVDLGGGEPFSDENNDRSTLAIDPTLIEATDPGNFRQILRLCSSEEPFRKLVVERRPAWKWADGVMRRFSDRVRVVCEPMLDGEVGPSFQRARLHHVLGNTQGFHEPHSAETRNSLFIQGPTIYPN
ncbi:hypothetical protein WN55_00475, partial [Dufourea novaeangliae]